MPRGHLIINVHRRMLGIARISDRRQQIMEIDRQAVARSDTQHQRAGTLVLTQLHLTRTQNAAGDLGAVGQRIHDIAAQCKHHAVDVLRADAVVHQRLIEGDHVGSNRARADRRLRHCIG